MLVVETNGGLLFVRHCARRFGALPKVGVARGVRDVYVRPWHTDHTDGEPDDLDLGPDPEHYRAGRHA